ncbi:double-strand break repair helicase AddA [Salaquimonas pukyongi]|uniref:double-strand break repair helicase AddA n=1 Tax=Salaquimonas pukyongi TaxID=2712698 RepID=UPI00096BA01E|nr:double-strand break repair helicase AddA [Salaquimonas pukyongi]
MTGPAPREEIVSDETASRKNYASAKLSRATDPAHSIWVSANAGSGKTYLLSRRVIRLLLEGSSPSELLCLTFTKAAAAEMSNRVFGILGEWSLMNQAELSREVANLLGHSPTGKEMTRARKLFALSLDTPGGLRIQTIHAFCESLLHQFALEANVPGHFQLLDTPEQTAFIAEARQRVELAAIGQLPPAAHRPQSGALADGFQTMRAHASEEAIEQAVREVLSQAHEFRSWVEQGGGSIKSAMAPLWETENLDRDMDRSTLLEGFLSETVYSKLQLEELAALARAKNSPRYDELADKLEIILSTTDPGVVFDVRRQIFLKDKDTPRPSLVHASFLNNEPVQAELLAKEGLLVKAQYHRLRTFDVLKASQALFTVLEAMLAEYDYLKHSRGRLDFDDLITKTCNLLSREGIGAWVRYKLDYGISHVLVDEAQDTSPLQWKIIEAVTQDFFAGESSHSQTRTLFVVGDEKQSIYSFQGADIREFDQQKRQFRRRVQSAGQKATPEDSLSLSYRSVPEVLSAVDQVFSLPENARGLGETATTRHVANRFSHSGDVIVWDMMVKPKRNEPESWLDDPSEQTGDAELRLAGRIADTIDRWVMRGERLPGHDRPIRCGDVLILVRKRDRFVRAMIRKLKEKGLPTAGADRLKLTEHILTEDLLALGRFAINRIDDLSLAGVLKSPIFDFSEDELFQLAHGRKGRLLYDTLAERAAADPDSRWAPAASQIEWIIGIAGTLSVYGFYARLCAHLDLRRRYVARLGHEVEEILDGFLQAALDHDANSGLGLQAFIETLASAEPEIKREIELESDEVRVITAHSAKGLEKPVVFLVDPGGPAYSASHRPKIAWTEDDAPLWIAKSEHRIGLSDRFFTEAERAAEEEYRRLLYVGMTRAADRLIVCGYTSERHQSAENWHAMVKRGLEAPPLDAKLNGRLEAFDDHGHPAWRWKIDHASSGKAVKPEEDAEKDLSDVTALPVWIAPVRQEPSPPRPLSPSGVLQVLEIGEPSAPVVTGGGDGAMVRGTVIHHLLQILPEIAPDKRTDAVRRYFAASRFRTLTGQLPREMQDKIASDIPALLQNPAMADLFGPNSRAEVEIMGKIVLSGAERTVHGKIDRLSVMEGQVIVADYKSGSQIPESPDAAPLEYLAQMALYREILKPLFPGRKIISRLIWTAGPTIMELDDPLLDHILERLAIGRHPPS